MTLAIREDIGKHFNLYTEDKTVKKKLVVSKNLQKPVLEKHIHYQASKLPRMYPNGDSHTQESASLY